jgi:DNA-binding MarR family transcriptional regulator
MTADGFDDLIHAPVRLRICSMLAEVTEAEFAAVRDTLGVSDSVLSKHVRTLEDAGYVAVRKGTVETRTRTWIKLTSAGRVAFTKHVAVLRLLAQTADTAPVEPLG